MSDKHTLPAHIDKSQLVPPIWPLGWGNVMSARNVHNGQALLMLRAVPDEFVGNPGTPVDDELWEKVNAKAAPTLLLSFKDADAIAQMINTLTVLLGEAVEAGL